MCRGIFLLICSLCFMFFSTTLSAGNRPVERVVVFSPTPLESGLSTIPAPKDKIPKWKIKLLKFALKKTGNNVRYTAVALAAALGPFGVHRLYLGTVPLVPVAYTLTLGGGLGILPATDIIAILATKDLTPFLNNSKVVMWAK